MTPASVNIICKEPPDEISSINVWGVDWIVGSYVEPRDVDERGVIEARHYTTAIKIGKQWVHAADILPDDLLTALDAELNKPEEW